jgi:hypothetical protein
MLATSDDSSQSTEINLASYKCKPEHGTAAKKKNLESVIVIGKSTPYCSYLI